MGSFKAILLRKRTRNHFKYSRVPASQVLTTLEIGKRYTASTEGPHGYVSLSGGASGIVRWGSPVTFQYTGAPVTVNVIGHPFHVQVEDGEKETESIFTTSEAELRGEEVADLSGLQADGFLAIQRGGVLIDLPESYSSATNEIWFSLRASNSTGSNNRAIRFRSSSTSSQDGQLNIEVFGATTGQALAVRSIPLSVLNMKNSHTKILITWDETRMRTGVNGTIYTDTVVVPSNMDRFVLGSPNNDAQLIKTLWYAHALPNTELINQTIV